MPTPHVLPPATPYAIRDELTAMVVNDLLDPAGGPDKELDQNEDRATARGILRCKGELISPPQGDLF